ncbi:MAG: hypothetical protein IJV30_00265 [Oscillospiraceae bacterium]|nr:hypothetical protein [Oscillospiraceae bacterium]
MIQPEDKPMRLSLDMIITEKYGKEVIIAPNSHFGYAEKPADFAKVLLKALT